MQRAGQTPFHHSRGGSEQVVTSLCSSQTGETRCRSVFPLALTVCVPAAVLLASRLLSCKMRGRNSLISPASGPGLSRHRSSLSPTEEPQSSGEPRSPALCGSAGWLAATGTFSFSNVPPPSFISEGRVVACVPTLMKQQFY